MPIYEYHCNKCGNDFSEFVLNKDDICKISCKHCHGRNLTKLLSAFSIHQTEESRIDNLDFSKPQGESFYKDSRNIGLGVKKKLKGMRVNLGSKMDEIIEKGRTGKLLEKYIK